MGDRVGVYFHLGNGLKVLSIATWRPNRDRSRRFGYDSPQTVYDEILAAFPVILLLIFMVAGIYFMKELLLFTFTKILLKVRSKILLSLLFSFTAAFLSAFLDALTVTAVIISVAVGFFRFTTRSHQASNLLMTMNTERRLNFRGE